MPLFPFPDNRKVQVSQLNSAVDNATRVKHQSADQIRNNSTTFLASPDLVLPVVANATYAFKALILYSSSTVADFKCRIVGPLGTTGLISPWSSSGSAVDSNLYHSASALSADVFAEGAGTATIMSCRPVGYVKTAAAGDLSISFAQFTAEVSETRLKLGSWVRLSRVA